MVNVSKWLKAFSLLILGTALMMALGCESLSKKRTIGLAKNGIPLMKIVLNSTNAIPAEKTAARELTTYLEKITGAKFEIIEEKDLPKNVPAIYLGVTKYAGAQGIDFSKLSSEESVLRTVGKNLILAGGRPRGTLYAVYEFLENDLGCRWYTSWCEKVPQKTNCVIPAINRSVKPYFQFRSHYYVSDEPVRRTWFYTRNRLNDDLARQGGKKGGYDNETTGAFIPYGGNMGGCHGFWYMTADFKDHPEYFSMRNGKRVPTNKEGKGACGLEGNHICLTNPDVLKIIVEEVKKDIRNDLKNGINAMCYTVAVNDGGCSTICDCPECRKVAKQYGATEEKKCTDAGLILWFVNQVADGIKDEFPDKFIRTLAYNPTGASPKNIRARDNVVVQVCGGPNSCMVYSPISTMALLKNVIEWAPYAKHIWLWDYACPCWEIPGFFRPYTWMMDEQMKLFKTLGSVDGMFQENEPLSFEDTMTSQFREMNVWIYARLCQNPDWDINVLIRDFMEGYYGEKAAPPLLRYLELIHAGLSRFPYQFFDYGFIAQSQKCFDEAEAAAKRQPELLSRVKELRIQLDLATLIWRNTIIRDYLRQGGKLDAYPYPKAFLKSRLLETLKAAQNSELTSKVRRTAADGKGKDVSITDIAMQYVESVSAGVEYTPLPKDLAALPFERVIDLTAPLFADRLYPIVVADPAATLGLAVPRMNTNECPMNICCWSNFKPNSGGVWIKAKDVKGKGYHLYQGPRFKLNEWTFIYLTASWQIQKHLYGLYDPANTNQQWDTYLSMKYTGPCYPFGETGETNALYIDRLILIKVDSKGNKVN